MPKSSPLKIHGGKSYLAEWIVSHFPPHLHYVEPFFGGGSVLFRRDANRNWMARNGEKLLAKDSGCSEVVNDINQELTNFWRVLKDCRQFEQLRRKLDATPFSQVVFAEATLLKSDDPIERAWATFVRYRQARQGIPTSGFAALSRNRTRGRINEQANAWLSAIDGLEEAHRRLRSVVILCDDAVKVIGQQDGPTTLFYLDPPYVEAARSSTGQYEYEMTVDDHVRLLEKLAVIEGRFLLSGYPNDLYDKYAAMYGWQVHKREIDNKASGAAQKETKVECLWANFECSAVKPAISPANLPVSRRNESL